jgi:predicted thioredoxin/glutaredoxin
VGTKEINEGNKVLQKKNGDALKEVEAQKADIYDLKRSNKIQKNINIKLNKELSRLRERKIS